MGTDISFNPVSAVNKEVHPTQEQHIEEITPIPCLRTDAQRSPSGTSTACAPSHSSQRRRIPAPSVCPDASTSPDESLNPDPEKGRNLEEDASQDEYWLLPTGFPIIAATFGPVANLFSICALVESWRVSETNDDDRVDDPPWAIGINALSLAFGILANIALLLTFLHLIPYRFAQPFTVISWFLSALLLIALIISFIHTPTLNPSNLPGTIWSQSYYYAIISATLYLSISLALATNLYGAYIQSHYAPSLRGLTGPQRSLMLQSVLYMIYLGGGAALFAHLENWRFLDAVYWADYTLLTIGLGSDFAPKTLTGRMVLLPYAWGGILTVGLVVAGVRGLVIEKWRGKVRLRHVRRGRAAVAKAMRKKLGRRPGRGVQDVLEKGARGNGDGRGSGDAGTNGDGKSNQNSSSPHEAPILHDEVSQVRQKPIQKTEWSGLTAAFIAYLLLWFGGAAAFYNCEEAQKWTYPDSLYFTNIALLTIGYGDLYPQSQSGKPFFVVWSLLAIPTVTLLVGGIQDTILSGLKRVVERFGKEAKDSVVEKEKENGVTDEEEVGEGDGNGGGDAEEPDVEEGEADTG